MSKFVILLVSVTFLFSCKQGPKAPDSAENKDVKDLNFETVIDDETLLLGKINREGLQMPEYKNWFDSTFQAYAVQGDKIDRINASLEETTIKIFMGTWCSDSQREVPAFYKILDQSNYDQSKVEMVGVDRDKILPNEEVEGYDIEFVPTIIFYKDGAELGRIIEMPQRTLEEDILEIMGEGI